MWPAQPYNRVVIRVNVLLHNSPIPSGLKLQVASYHQIVPELGFVQLILVLLNVDRRDNSIEHTGYRQKYEII